MTRIFPISKFRRGVLDTVDQSMASSRMYLLFVDLDLSLHGFFFSLTFGSLSL